MQRKCKAKKRRKSKVMKNKNIKLRVIRKIVQRERC